MVLMVLSYSRCINPSMAPIANLKVVKASFDVTNKVSEDIYNYGKPSHMQLVKRDMSTRSFSVTTPDAKWAVWKSEKSTTITPTPVEYSVSVSAPRFCL